MNCVVRLFASSAKSIFAKQSCNVNSRLLSFKSAVSLESIYPKSSLSITTPVAIPPADAKEKFNGFIPIEKLEITYSRSSGPGGQNVNTVSTKVDLRFQVHSATWLNEDVRAKMIQNHTSKINKEGYIIIRSDKTRSQQLNLADAMERLRSLLREAAEPELVNSVETEEKLRRRREKNARIRLMEKRLRSQTKADRQAPMTDF